MLSNKTVTVDSDNRRRDSLGNHASTYLVGEKKEPDKGQRSGSCNFTSCQRPRAFWLHSNGHYYCGQCAQDLHKVNKGDDWWKPLVLDRAAVEEHEAKAKAVVQ